ncbi:cellulose synthase subunit BcsC-related outer membrane protein [Psychromonas aquatilis]|uniref:Cellulose synthase subunit BcsC-related outer membrane protein n=1 Tax=Psychromonas aquatilis TaxID=2005072 RepID=A0ABU9GND2_9GAMM
MSKITLITTNMINRYKPFMPAKRLALLITPLMLGTFLFSLVYTKNTYANENTSNSIITYQPFTFTTDLTSVDSQEWLINQLVYAQLLNRPDISEATLERLLAINPNSLAGLKYQALYLSKIQKVDKAQAALKKLQSQYPNAPETKQVASYLSIYSSNRNDYQQAKLLSISGQYAAALAIYNKIFSDGIPTPALQLEYILLEDNKTGNWQQTQNKLIKLNNDYPGTPQFQLALARHTLSEKPTDTEALTALQQLTLAPSTSNSAAKIWLALLDKQRITADVLKQYAILSSYRSGDQTYLKAYDDAKKRFEEEKERLKDPTYITKLEGLALFEAKRYYAAEPKLLAALKTRPKDLEIVAALGYVYLRTGRQGLAVNYFKQAEQYDPDKRYQSRWQALTTESLYWVNIDQGDLYMERGQYTKAKQKYQASVKLQPDTVNAYNALAELAFIQKQYSVAEKYYLITLKKQPLNKNALIGRIDIREEQQNKLAAYRFSQGYSAAQRKVVRSQIGALYSDVLLADLKQALAENNYQTATDKVNQLLKNPPSSVWDKADIAYALQTMGEATRADRLMKQWSSNKDPNFQFAYALYLSRYGETETAIEVLQAIPPKQRTTAMQNNLDRLSLSLAFEQLSELVKTDPDAAKAKIDQMLLENQNRSQVSIQLITMKYQLGFEQEAYTDINKQSPESTWSYQTQLDYGNLLYELNIDKKFVAWKDQLPAPKGTQAEVVNYTQQRDILFAKYAMGNKDYATAEALYYPIATGNTNDAIDAQYALVDIYSAQGNTAALEKMTLQLYKDKQKLSNYQVAQLSQLLNEQGQTQQALTLSRQLSTTKNAGAFDYRTGMNVAMDNQEYELAKSLGYQALLSDQQAKSPSTTTNDNKDFQQLYDEADDYWLTRSVKSDIDTIHKRNDGYIEFGIDYSGRDSENNATQIPVEISIPMPDYDGHLILRADMVALNSGDLNYFNKDTGSNSDTQFSSTENGIELGIGWRANTWSADIGTTPIGFETQTWVGGLNLSGDLGDFGWRTTLSRRSDTSSTLSFGGMQVPDIDIESDNEHIGEYWGNVVRTGVKLGLSYDTGAPVGYWGGLQYHYITGHNVEDNTSLALLGGAYWKLISERDKQLSVGLNSFYSQYDKNLSEYAYGYGGYYSPQQYISLSIPVNWYQRINNDFSYLIRGSISNSWSEEDPLYGAAGESSSGGGIGYSFEAALEKRVSDHWYIGLAVDMQLSDFYEPRHGLLYARYTFSDRWQPIEMPVDPISLYSEFD